MWLRIAVLVVIAGCLSSMAQGASIEDPMADFLVSEAFLGFARYDPDVHVSRADVDINGDGKKIVLLAADYTRHAGYDWTAYLPGKNGYTVALLSPRESEMLAFTQYNAFVGDVREIHHRGLVFFQGRGVDGFGFFAFWISNGRARIKKIGRVAKSNIDAPSKPEPLFRRYFPDLQATSENPPFNVETFTLDDLRAKGYAIPKMSK